MTQYVQHISGTGKKYVVVDCPGPVWTVWLVQEGPFRYTLPIEEYRACDPPNWFPRTAGVRVGWLDVTAECEVRPGYKNGGYMLGGAICHTPTAEDVQRGDLMKHYEIVKLASSVTPCFVVRKRVTDAG